MLSENSSDLYNTVGNTSSAWGIKKRAWYSRQASPTFSGVEVAGWVLLGCLGGEKVLKLMELTGLGDGIQELEKCCRIPDVLRVFDITDEPAL